MARDTYTLDGIEYDADDLQKAIELASDDDGDINCERGGIAIVGNVVVRGDTYNDPDADITTLDNVTALGPGKFAVEDGGKHHFKDTAEVLEDLEDGFGRFREDVIDSTCGTHRGRVTTADTREESGDHDLAVSISTSVNMNGWTLFENFGEDIAYINGGETESGHPFDRYDGLERPASGTKQPVTFFLEYPSDRYE
jgi:hypothetical protein